MHHFVAIRVQHRVAAPYSFNSIIDIVQQYKEDCTILQICWAVAVPCTEQIVSYVRTIPHRAIKPQV